MRHAKYIVAVIGATLTTAAAADPTGDLSRALFDQDQKEALAAIASGADPNAHLAGGNALYSATYQRMWDVARELVNRGAAVNAKTSEGDTPLLAALSAQSAVDPQLVSMLLDHGADANVRNSAGNTALALGVLTGNANVVRALLAHGADVNAKMTLEGLFDTGVSDWVGLPSSYVPSEMNAFQVAQAQEAAGHGNAQILQLLRSAGGGSGSSVSGSSSPTAADANRWMQRPHFSTTSGRVGYHLVSNLQWYKSEVPAECNGDIRTQEVTVQGTLPPGLTADDPRNFLAIQGTPRQPGDWNYAVLIHGVFCNGQSYGDRRVDVNFHVDP